MTDQQRPDSGSSAEHFLNQDPDLGGQDRRPLRILMVSARFAPFVGGTEIHTGRVADELSRRGHSVTVLTTDGAGSLPEEEHIGLVRVLRVPAYPAGSDLYLSPAIGREIKAGRWDLVHVQGYHTAVAPIALVAAQRVGLPTVLTFHSGGHSSRLRNMIRPIQVRYLQRYLLRAERLFGVSDFEANLFARRLGIRRERITVIPNGVSPGEGETTAGSATPESGTDDQRPTGTKTLLSIGRLVRYKGHHKVIQAMPHLLSLEPDTKLLILGRGPYEKELRKLARKLGVSDHVEFDFIPSEESHRLRAILRDASLAVLLSDYESHGMAAHEALTVGLPLAVMDKSALSELVTSGLAQAIPPHATSREVAEIVARCLHRPVEVATGPTEPTPTWSTIADRLEHHYYQVVNGEPNGYPSKRRSQNRTERD